jgi:hypothetical protein
MASQDLYEEHKLAVEEALRARLGARLTILRLANIFGYERGRGGACSCRCCSTVWPTRAGSGST